MLQEQEFHDHGTLIKDTKKYWSAKDKFHALKYEVAVSLGKHIKIVYVSGSHYGSDHDLTIARSHCLPHLEENESVVADLIYASDHRVITYKPNTDQNRRENKIIGNLRQNVERMNNRIKVFNAAARWRGRRENHRDVFFAICHLVNLELDATPLNGDEPTADLIII